MKNINLENAWCKTTQENYDALINLGYKPSDNITNAFRNDFETHLRIESDIVDWGHKNCIGAMENPDYWSKDREIHLVNGEFEYVEIKPKNNFKEFGFKADFEGVICFQDDDFNIFFGFIVEDGKKLARSWNKYGVSGMSYEYDLTPIKKEWYENPDNFPCLVYMEDKRDEEDKGYYTVLGNMNSYKSEFLIANIIRPATEEEVLALLVKE